MSIWQIEVGFIVSSMRPQSAAAPPARGVKDPYFYILLIPGIDFTFITRSSLAISFLISCMYLTALIPGGM